MAAHYSVHSAVTRRCEATHRSCPPKRSTPKKPKLFPCLTGQHAINTYGGKVYRPTPAVVGGVVSFTLLPPYPNMSPPPRYPMGLTAHLHSTNMRTLLRNPSPLLSKPWLVAVRADLEPTCVPSPSKLLSKLWLVAVRTDLEPTSVPTPSPLFSNPWLVAVRTDLEPTCVPSPSPLLSNPWLAAVPTELGRLAVAAHPITAIRSACPPRPLSLATQADNTVDCLPSGAYSLGCKPTAAPRGHKRHNAH
jgi:hypothetical protein